MNVLKAMQDAANRKNVNAIQILRIGEDGISSVSVYSANACNNCYSVAKAFMVAAIGMLWDEGLLRVEDLIWPLFAGAFPQNADQRCQERDKGPFSNVLFHSIVLLLLSGYSVLKRSFKTG